MNDIYGDKREEEDGTASSPLELLRIVWQRKLLVIVCVALSVGAALAYALTSPPQHEGTSTVEFRDPGFARTLFGSDLFEGGVNPERDTSTNIEVIQSASVVDRVKRAIGPSVTLDELYDGLEVNAGENSNIVYITATSEDPVKAARIASAFAAEYVAYQRLRDRRKVREARTLVARSLDGASSDERQGLLDSLKQLRVLEALQTGNADVVSEASPEANPVSPQPIMDGLLAGALGLVAGVVLALIADLVDRRLKSTEDFEGAFGHPVIASIPRGAVPDRHGGLLSAAKAEPYRMLREGLRFLEVSGHNRCVLVTSPDAGEGKSTVAVQLARALVSAGQSVILIEADLRRPTLARHLGIEPKGMGLSGGLVFSSAVLEDLLETVDNSGLRILPTGPVPPNPADLLRKGRLRNVLEDARESADMVIIDAPPLVPVSDTRVLLDVDLVDGVLVLGRAYSTTRPRAKEARRILERSGRRVLGLVVTFSRSQSERYYHGAGENANRRLDSTGPEDPVPSGSAAGARRG